MGLVFSVYSKFFFPLSTFGFSNTSKSMIFPHGEERAYALPLNNPPVIKGSLATHMDPNDLIVGISFSGDSDKYKVKIIKSPTLFEE